MRASRLLAIVLLLPSIAFAAPASAPAAPPAAAPAAPTRCLLLVDLKTGKTVLREGDAQCAERFSPCSTFKIFNALVGLETGVLRDENTLYRWDGKDRGREAWNRDQTLASAMRDSAVWYFQRVAAEIGPERMQAWLDRVGYGNRDISGDQQRFWLESSLLISADEQVAFVAKLYRGELPFRPDVVATVKKILVQSDEAGVTFSGKTGSGEREDGRRLGWFVGDATGPRGEYVFAVNLLGMDDGIDGRRAKEVAREMLRARGLLP